MMTLNISIPWIAVAGLMLAALIFNLRLHRRQRDLAAELKRALDGCRTAEARLADGLRQAFSRNAELDARCARLDRRLLAFEARQKRLEQRKGEGRYELALQMAGHGADVEQLVAAGLSRGEAELALRMHGLGAAQ